jgi:hypothetical protein
MDRRRALRERHGVRRERALAAWIQGNYQATKTAYVTKNGVPADRVVLVEHFGNTTTNEDGYHRGQDGLGDADWRDFIVKRKQAAQAVGFAGYASYAWGHNHIPVTQDQRHAYMSLYSSLW